MVLKLRPPVFFLDFFAPGVAGQSRVIREAHQMAGVPPETITYIETHGTGTKLGDPLEIQALRTAFEQDRRRGSCAIGSVKTNVGHLHTAAGIMGLIKTVLMLQHRCLVPSLHYKVANPGIDFGSTPFYVNVKTCPWHSGDAPRRAGVSAFGFGGVNAHVVLEEAPSLQRELLITPDGETKTDPQLLVLSARTTEALARAVKRLGDFLQTHREVDLADVAYTLQVHRAEFSHRRFFVVGTVAEAVTAFTVEPGKTLQENPADGEVNSLLQELSQIQDDTKRRQGLKRLGQIWQAGEAINWSELHDK